MTPLVSILIPAYNSERWLAETLQSALAQTWPRKEIIVVVDEGSSDATLTVARAFASGEISVISRSHRSAAAARNEAYSLCQGDYIQWLDADDLLSANKIESQMKAVAQSNNKNVLMSCAWGHFRYRPSEAKFVATALWNDLSPIEWLLRKMGENLYMQPATWLASRQLCEAAGPWDASIKVDEDGEYFNRLVSTSAGIRFVPEGKVFYRMSGFGSYTYRAIAHADARWRSMQLQLQHLLSQEDSARSRPVALNYLQAWLLHFYPERMDIVEEMERCASTLGGHLAPPPLRWKYSWMAPVVGYSIAKRAQFFLPYLKSAALGSWDKLMSSLAKSDPS